MALWLSRAGVSWIYDHNSAVNVNGLADKELVRTHDRLYTPVGQKMEAWPTIGSEVMQSRSSDPSHRRAGTVRAPIRAMHDVSV